ncbi:carboxylesterase/lipase family protein [Planomonospora venezuelensis]|uniref:Para-nitrobenzyl esterase n=1 Tax=Planomonospora venezuelensis TaxID=1999 RepID=A0A841D2P8_PLAVE|nr:carboxylesterase family protein [Planomonospora venezuelensis]MBB5964942.1 para-nitrobenzyl esterase [Planomonospora venezuelensis]GIN03305.1 carboxylic ester hydrolase [Planomonospora venezuelensis]
MRVLPHVRRSVRRAVLPAALLLTACAGTPAQADPAVVRTETGAVRGTVTPGHRTFHGIPYAAAGRWESPRRAGPWTGVRDATAPGNMCPQVGSDYAPVASTAEDCLVLNVTAPRGRDAGLPVMVWLHGDGALGAGHFSDARPLAARGTVVVTINYRLGVFGAFGYPGLKDSGTYGLQDQQAALAWVRRNIRAFGGDPGNVTVFGLSYGALSIGGHLTSPGAKGLFHRAIMQSGETMMDMPAGSLVPGLPAQPSMGWRGTRETEALGVHYAGRLGCRDLACLRALPVERILREPQIMNAFQAYAYGNRVLPEIPSEAIRAGRHHRVPVLAGATRDEHRLFVGMNHDAQGRPLIGRRYRELVAEAFGEDAGRILRRYPARSFPSPGIAWATVLTDRMWARATHEQNTLLARYAPVYGYEFADRDAPMFLPLKTDFDWGAYHAGDLPYLFPEKAARLDPGQRELSRQMIAYWTNFARAGDPNGPGLPAWPRVDGGVQSLAPGAVRPVDYAAGHRLDFWN